MHKGIGPPTKGKFENKNRATKLKPGFYQSVCLESCLYWREFFVQLRGASPGGVFTTPQIFSQPKFHRLLIMNMLF